ncbi:hypothetical protein Ct9H90mP29_06230 [bacterium]|nr:MAG: hypothetical protein Ct9H90mP29_06230 [bacterium]
MYEHLWQGVAGKIEEGETSWEAAIRELEEETGFFPSGCLLLIMLVDFMKHMETE